MEAAGSGSQARSPSAITFSLRRIICHIDGGGTIAGVEVDAAVLRLGIVFVTERGARLKHEWELDEGQRVILVGSEALGKQVKATVQSTRAFASMADVLSWVSVNTMFKINQTPLSPEEREER